MELPKLKLIRWAIISAITRFFAEELNTNLYKASSSTMYTLSGSIDVIIAYIPMSNFLLENI